MKGQLSPDVYDVDRQPDTWWRADAGDWASPLPLDTDIATDVAIIGGGYAGLGCARRPAEFGIAVTVLEAGDIGWGASGRNGGIVGLTSHKLDDARLLARHGRDEVARYHAAQLEGVGRLKAFCENNNLANTLQGSGEAIYAHSYRAASVLAAESLPKGVSAEPLEPSDRDDMAQDGGVMIRPGFGVQPLRLVRALAQSAMDAGVRVYARSTVRNWHRTAGHHVLRSKLGTVRADRVVIATNGFTPDGLYPEMDARAVPVISNIAVTRPLTAGELAQHPWLGASPVCDTRNLLVYLRRLPENRLLFGLRGDLTGADANAPAMRKRVVRRIGQCFPGWANIQIDHFWRGPICATTALTPSVGPMENDKSVFHALGWHGSGVNGAQVGGRLLADVIAGAPLESIPAPFRGRATRLPFAELRPLYVGAALLKQRALDAMS
ncbi:MAG: FAD-binding oxidoreductase [Pseudomonadota bacterium]